MSQQLTSRGPASKNPEDKAEVALAKFMADFDIKSRKGALKLQRSRDNAAESLHKTTGVPMTQARQFADKNLKDNISGRPDFEEFCHED
jgi:hypothetical protein